MSGRRKSRELEAAAKPLRADGSIVVTSAQRWVRRLAPLLVALVTLVAFLPALQNQFVAWDDDKNFLENHHYRGLAWTHLRWMWTAFHMGHYTPLTWMTLGLDHLLWGMNPVGYHLSSFLLHATNAVVFYFLVLRLLSLALPGPIERGHAPAISAAFAALVFAVHPLRVESVAWITERRDVLSGLFFLLTILAYLRACEREACERERGRRWHWLSVASFGCALLSKSMAVSLPVVLLILDVYPLRRLGGSVGWSSEPARRIYAEKVPFVLLAAAASVLAFMAQLSLHPMASLARLSVPGRLAASAYGVSFYLWKTVVPLGLSPLYEMPPTVNPGAMPFVLSSGVVVAITATALALRRRLPGLPAVWVAYVVVLLPVLGIFQNGPQIAADRYTYLAGLGWAILAGAGLLSCWRMALRSKTGTATTLPLAGMAIGVVAVLGILTGNQAQVWHDSERLWTYALAIDASSPIAQDSLGTELDRQGKPTEAIEHFQQALRLKPDYALAHNNWGVALMRQGMQTEAIEHFRQALRIEPDLAEAHNNWGVALTRQDKPAGSTAHLLQLLHLSPELVEAHEAPDRQGRLAEAVEHFKQALRIDPDLAEAHGNWGLALAQQGKLAEAAEHLQQALRMRPDLADDLAHTDWGVALAQQGNLTEAIRRVLERDGQKAE